jgi:hypothetical protein
LKMTIPAYLRHIAINGDTPKFGKKHFTDLLNKVDDLIFNIDQLYGRAYSRDFQIVDYGATKRALGDLVTHIKAIQANI